MIYQDLEAVDRMIGNRLKIKRISQGMSQQELAVQTGLTFQQIQKYEKGINRISGSRLYQFCRILNERPNYFFNDIFQDDLNDGFLMDDVSNVAALKELASLVKIYQSIKSDKVRSSLKRFMQDLVLSDHEEVILDDDIVVEVNKV